MGLVRAVVLCSAFVAAAACGGEERTPSLETVTPRPTGTPTATPERTPVATIVEPVPVAVAMVVRGSVSGTPADGGELVALVDGITCGRTLVSPAGRFEVSVHEESAGGFRGCALGLAVRFGMGGRGANETAVLERRGKRPLELDLTFTAE